MNHDIAHCEGEIRVASCMGNPTGTVVQCPKRFDCQRYLAHLDLRVNARQNCLYSYFDAEECIDLEFDRFKPKDIDL